MAMDILCLDFVNSEWYDGRGRLVDRLGQADWLRAFLARWGFAPAREPSGKTRTRFLHLRTALRRLVEDLASNQSVGRREVAILDRCLASVPVRRRLISSAQGHVVRLVPLSGGWDAVLAEIAASGADLISRYDGRRVRVCANPGCRWVFYDTSKGGQRRWCRPNACGNVDKVRRFRERQRGGRRRTGKGRVAGSRLRAKE